MGGGGPEHQVEGVLYGCSGSGRADLLDVLKVIVPRGGYDDGLTL